MMRVITCEWCGKTIETQRRRKRFCDKSCSAKWRVRQPQFRVPYSDERRSASAARMRQQNADPRFRESLRRYLGSDRNPFRDPAKRAEMAPKVYSKLAAGGWRHLRGGNGRGLTVPQRMLSEALGWATEYVVPCGARRDGYPTAYKIDLANPDAMVGVEVDGMSHMAADRKCEDAKKEAFLSSLGWTIIRVRNAEVLADLDGVVRAIQSACPSSTFAQAPATTSPMAS